MHFSAVGLRAQRVEDLLDVRGVLLRLLEMLLEPPLELVVLDLADQHRQRLLHELLLDVEDVSELVQEELA
jgi:hypothetical protein